MLSRNASLFLFNFSTYFSVLSAASSVPVIKDPITVTTPTTAVATARNGVIFEIIPVKLDNAGIQLLTTFNISVKSLFN